MSCVRFLRHVLPGLLATSLVAQIPPQALDVAKKVGTQLLEKALKPKMKVDSFTLGGIKATEVDCDGEATPEKFSGTATFALPAPLGPRKLEFKGLVLKGSTAEGAFDAVLKDFSSEHQGWTYALAKLSLSDKGGKVEGTATRAGLKLDLSPLNMTPQGLQGTLTPGDLPLAEGPFAAHLLDGEVSFGPQGIRLKGNLDVLLNAAVRHGATGTEVHLEGGPVAFDGELLGGTGTVAPALATNLSLRHKGQIWMVQHQAFGFERGTPILSGPTRLQFPLNVFCRVGASDQPYQTEAITCQIRGRVPSPAAPIRLSRGGTIRPPAAMLQQGWEGFSGSFALAPAVLHPSGLTGYRLDLQGGTVRVDKGVLNAQETRLSAELSWGPSQVFKTVIKEAPAELADGLYAVGGAMTVPAHVGAFQVDGSQAPVVCDFSTSDSPKDLPDGWMGIYVPAFHLTLPMELYTATDGGMRLPVSVVGKSGRFEGNGSFSGSVAVTLKNLVNLHIVPVRLDPFELRFFEGALLNGPLVKGSLELDAPTLLDNFKAPLSFHLTQNGVGQIEINTQTPQGPMAVNPTLVGVTMVLDAMRLYPTALDFSGRFDFAVAGAELPSIPFDHITLEAKGGGIEGSNEKLSFEFKGSRWSNLADRQSVSLWGFPLALAENGYGVTADGRFYVGLGGDIDVNPLLPTIYNRFLFTTEKDNPNLGTIELEKLFDVNQSVASMGSMKASLGFQVKAADDQVSDAYFLGSGALDVDMGETKFGLDAGLRFGRSYQGSAYFPYFYALGHFEAKPPMTGVQVAPNLEIYGLTGGLAQNFLPDDIRNTTEIQGKPDKSLGIAVIAGVDAGTTDRYTFHGGLDLYVSQNLTTLLQGKGWLMAGRDKQPADNQVTADIRFTRNPNTFHANLEANLNLYQGVLRPMGRVELHFGPDQQYVHVGTRDVPVQVRFLNQYDGSGYFTTDFKGGTATFGAGAAFSYSREGDFGIVWGNAWLNARGDLIIEIDADMNPRFLGSVAADGGAAFGMKFKTFWKTYRITIFSGSIATNLACQIPGSPTLSGAISIHYSVLGGAFSGSVSANLNL